MNWVRPPSIIVEFKANTIDGIYYIPWSLLLFKLYYFLKMPGWAI